MNIPNEILSLFRTVVLDEGQYFWAVRDNDELSLVSRQNYDASLGSVQINAGSQNVYTARIPGKLGQFCFLDLATAKEVVERAIN
jgi:hypothetical protein